MRVAKKSGAVIPKPEYLHLKYINRIKNKQVGINDTVPDDVIEKTYKGEDFLRVKAEFDEYIRIKEEKEAVITTIATKHQIQEKW